MRLAFILLVALAGLASGLALTSFAIGPAGRYFARVVLPWEFSPRLGAPEIDPYSRARVFAEGELPLAAGEGYALRARSDGSGAPLLARCRYRLTNPFPAARYWTVTLTDPSGRVIPNAAERNGFTSAEIVRLNEAGFAIEIGPDPIAGNWLPTGRREGQFLLILRFYETPLSATATSLDPRALPRLTRENCPP